MQAIGVKSTVAILDRYTCCNGYLKIIHIILAQEIFETVSCNRIKNFMDSSVEIRFGHLECL